MSRIKNPYKHFPRFVLRTPVLSFDFYKKLTSGTTIPNSTLKQVYEEPLIKEACFLASPSLYFEMEKWAKGELDKKKEKKIRYSLLKYLTRMTARCTPFGLFAGCSLGEFHSSTVIKIGLPHSNTRHTRLDMNYLVAFSHDISKKKGIREQLRYYPNSSIYSTGKQLRYIEYYYVESRRHHHIVEVDNSEYLQKILVNASSGAYLHHLIKLLTEDDIPEEDAENFISELMDSQLLVSELEPSVSGSEFMPQINGILKKIEGTTKEIDFLSNIEKYLNHLDNHIGNDTEIYMAITRYLKEYPTSFELKYLFQTDMELLPKENKLSIEVVEAIKKGMILLNKLTPPPAENNLSKFKEAFLERYEAREIPLAKALDVETGIGYLQDRGNGDVNPLIDDIVLPYKQDVYNKTAFSKTSIQGILERKLIECDKKGRQKIILTNTDFEDYPLQWNDLPDTISAMIEIITEDGNEKVQFSGIGGSSAANLLGRFCHGDEALNQHTKNITAIESEINPDKILAEIVHLPEARAGNILMRPSFRDYEIPYLAKSNLAPDHQILLDDLFISVKNDRIVLRSKKINKEVLPHLSNAHNFSINALPIYQFLCDMQTQNLRSSIYFNFGFLENNRTFVPRVEYENLILQKAKWKLKNKDVEALKSNSNNNEVFQKILNEFRKRLKLPQYVLLSDGDNELLVNFENNTSVLMLLDTVKNRPEFLLTEFLFGNDGIVKSDSDYYTHQIIVSFYNEEKLRSQKKEENG
ncbi:lantibiotic dehydratase family protein [Spongiimicrobium salis]|uniref:lantibiotic dehydratase family protein n=1 Tax=Spongiimicrobium salis TaxID=1667022 RepID=UPI00374DA515